MGCFTALEYGPAVEEQAQAENHYQSRCTA